MGMAVGLIPVPGRIITELTALSLLAEVTATVIGRGGIMGGAEGATTFVVQGGDQAEVQKLCRLVLKLKRARTSAVDGSKEECRRSCPSCDNHLGGCIYAGKEKTKLPPEVTDDER